MTAHNIFCHIRANLEGHGNIGQGSKGQHTDVARVTPDPLGDEFRCRFVKSAALHDGHKCSSLCMESSGFEVSSAVLGTSSSPSRNLQA